MSLRNRIRPCLESLEDRRVMSVSVQQYGSTLYLWGDSRSDTVQLTEFSTSPYSGIADVLIVGWKDDLGNSGSGSYFAPGLSKIFFQGFGGNDFLQIANNPTGAPVVINQFGVPVASMVPWIEAYGGLGSDSLWGSAKADVLYGEDGDDKLYGGSGSDRLDGGRNNDVLDGGVDNDTYDFRNQSIGGGSLGFDTVNESANNGTDTLYFFGGMNRAVNVNLGTIAAQSVNEYLSLRLNSAAAIENVEGTNYNDVIRGNGLDNYFYASDGNDILYGLGGNDTLDGSWHNDRLYAGDGNDRLYGGGGNDGLFAGLGVDYLYGESGADRFLVQEYMKFDPYAPPQNQDIVMDAASEDATIQFKAGNKFWATVEIERLDQAFAILHNATNNTRLLKLSSGGLMNFRRVSGFDAGDNSNGTITLTDLVMNGNSTWEVGYALHEIGHNWDTESPIWNNFLNLSRWTQTDPKSTDYTKITKYNQTWWYLTNSAFASNYARTHPLDDFAESFAAYFLQKAGLPWYTSDGSGAVAIPAKIQVIDTWVKSL